MDYVDILPNSGFTQTQPHILAPGSLTKRLATKKERAFLYTRTRIHNALSLAAADAVAFCMAFLVAGAVRMWWLGAPLIPEWISYLLPIWLVGAVLMRLLPSWGLGPVEELRRVTGLLLLVYAGMAIALFLTKQSETVSRLTLTVALGTSMVTVPLMRVWAKGFLSNLNLWGVPTVIYGAGSTGAMVTRLLQEEQGLGYNPIGVFDDDPSSWGGSVEEVDVLGSADEVAPHAPIAILAMPGISRERRIELLEGPLSNYRTVLVIPDLFEAPSLWVRPRDLRGILGLEITCNLENPVARFIKRAVDALLVLAAAPVWVPVCALVALSIWLEDRRSPFFLQERIGKDGRPFKTFKFRTMVPDAEAVLQRKLAEDPALRQEWETFYKLRKDPRITRVGRLLRPLSLDELPQLVNVLRGDMSLVGPRPLPAYHHYELASRVCSLRERVRPGITGLWQVSGRSDTGTAGMERWDPYYVRNWSLWLDIVVLVRTVRAVVKGSGAY